MWEYLKNLFKQKTNTAIQGLVCEDFIVIVYDQVMHVQQCREKAPGVYELIVTEVPKVKGITTFDNGWPVIFEDANKQV